MLAYSVKQAAEQLGICQRLVRELVREKKIRSIKVGSRIIIPHTELERLLAPPPEQTTTVGEILTLTARPS